MRRTHGLLLRTILPLRPPKIRLGLKLILLPAVMLGAQSGQRSMTMIPQKQKRHLSPMNGSWREPERNGGTAKL